LEATDPLIIKPYHDGNVKLEKDIRVRSRKTLDCSGKSVKFWNRGLSCRGEHIHLHNFEIEKAGNDALQAKRSNHLIFSHLKLGESYDGLLDITLANPGGCRVTVINTLFSKHNKAMLIGLRRSQDPYNHEFRVSVIRCWFDDCTQRMPRVEGGYAHVVNTFAKYDHYAFGSQGGANVCLENCWAQAFKGRDKATRIDGGNLGAFDCIGYDGAVFREHNRDATKVARTHDVPLWKREDVYEAVGPK
jgi:pectate lyase